MTAKRKNQQPQAPEDAQGSIEPEAPQGKKPGVYVCKGKAVTCGTKIKGECDEIVEKDGFNEKSLSDLLKAGVIEIVK